MKKFQRFCAAVILTVVLALSASAGDMGFPGATSPPPPPTESSATTTGSEATDSTVGDESSDSNSTLDPVLEAALSLLQSILSLF
jgi:hypothetical protein